TPPHRAVTGRYQSDADSHLAGGALDRAGEEGGDAELPSDGALIEPLGLERTGADSADHPHTRLGDGSGHLLGQADAEVVIRRIATQVRKREHGKRLLSVTARRLRTA